MSDDSRQILTVNAGSGSLHVDLFPWEGDEPLASHDMDWQGERAGYAGIYRRGARGAGAYRPRSRSRPIGHRVVHGGTHYQRGVRIDEDVKRTIREYRAAGAAA